MTNLKRFIEKARKKYEKVNYCAVTNRPGRYTQGCPAVHMLPKAVEIIERLHQHVKDTGNMTFPSGEIVFTEIEAMLEEDKP